MHARAPAADPPAHRLVIQAASRVRACAQIKKVHGKKTGKDFKRFEPIPEDDPKQRQPDITRAQSLLNWSPTVSLEEGLVKTVHWFRQQLQSDQ